MTSYGMFTSEGNAKVAAIVEWAIANRAEWTDVLPVLNNLARSDYAAFGEANDTAVREAVYDACNFTCDFYA